MYRAILWNGLMNLVLASAFVLLSNRALRNGLEETLIAYAVLYGLVVLIANAGYVAALCARRERAL